VAIEVADEHALPATVLAFFARIRHNSDRRVGRARTTLLGRFRASHRAATCRGDGADCHFLTRDITAHFVTESSSLIVDSFQRHLPR
jgi:hypothetical protein